MKMRNYFIMLLCMVAFSAAAGCNTDQTKPGLNSSSAGSYAEASSSTGISSSVTKKNTGDWVKAASMSVPRYWFQTQAVNGKLYAIGGLDDNTRPLSTVEEYDPETDQWVTKAPMATARVEFRTELIDGMIYAMGGFIDSDKFNTVTSLSSVEQYDPAANKWVIKAPMATPRHDFQTEVIGGQIYAMGGAGENSILSVVEVYNPVSNTWSERAPMPAPQTHFKSEAIDGKTYVFGSSDGRMEVEEYDPVSNIWTIKSPTPVLRYNF